jgi:hypothetical protein
VFSAIVGAWRLTQKKNFSPDSVVLMVIGDVPLSAKCNWKLRRSSADGSDVSLLGLGLELAHVLDHALAKR